jgi:hypothetical protein
MGWKRTQVLVTNILGAMVGSHGHTGHAMLHKHYQGKQKIKQSSSPPTHKRSNLGKNATPNQPNQLTSIRNLLKFIRHDCESLPNNDGML